MRFSFNQISSFLVELIIRIINKRFFLHMSTYIIIKSEDTWNFWSFICVLSLMIILCLRLVWRFIRLSSYKFLGWFITMKHLHFCTWWNNWISLIDWRIRWLTDYLKLRINDISFCSQWRCLFSFLKRSFVCIFHLFLIID